MRTGGDKMRFYSVGTKVLFDWPPGEKINEKLVGVIVSFDPMYHSHYLDIAGYEIKWPHKTKPVKCFCHDVIAYDEYFYRDFLDKIKDRTE